LTTKHRLTQFRTLYFAVLENYKQLDTAGQKRRAKADTAATQKAGFRVPNTVLWLMGFSFSN
jgi:hypothetical protein